MSCSQRFTVTLEYLYTFFASSATSFHFVDHEYIKILAGENMI